MKKNEPLYTQNTVKPKTVVNLDTVDPITKWCYQQYLEGHPDAAMTVEEYVEHREKHKYDLYNWLMADLARTKEEEGN